MQKEEIKSKRRSRELEGPASWREHRAMISHHDRRAARERQVAVVHIDKLFIVYCKFHCHACVLLLYSQLTIIYVSMVVHVSYIFKTS